MTEKEIKDKAYRCDYPYGHGNHVKDAAEYGYLQGANDVLKNMYSEEDMVNALRDGFLIGQTDENVDSKKWVEQYKQYKQNKEGR